MKVFTNPPLRYDVEEFMRFCHLNRIRYSIEDVEAIIDEGYRLIDPKAAYRRLKISKVSGGRVLLDGGWVLESKLLAEKFRCTPEVAVYVTTIGPALERRVSELGSKELSKSFILDCVGTYSLRQIFDIIQKDFQAEEEGTVSKFSPGSTVFWDIRQQKTLFDILDAERVRRVLGVRLNEYNVMIPRKSVSGVMGDTEERFHECQICKRRCEYRKAPYKAG